MNDNKVVDFTKFKEENCPHISGPAVCQTCKYKWVAVCPAGTVVLECPSCGLNRGVYRDFIGVAPDDIKLCCGLCENDIFVFRVEPDDTTSIICMGCGDVKDVDVLTD